MRGVAAGSCVCVVAKNEASKIEKETVLLPFVSAPVKKGDKIGHMTLKLDGEVLAEADIVAESDVGKISFAKMYLKILKKWAA